MINETDLREKEHITDALMVSLSVVMNNETLERRPSAHPKTQFSSFFRSFPELSGVVHGRHSPSILTSRCGAVVVIQHAAQPLTPLHVT
jgi:hypothetical protein